VKVDEKGAPATGECCLTAGAGADHGPKSYNGRSDPVGIAPIALVVPVPDRKTRCPAQVLFCSYVIGGLKF
jgi:hypothetical protein